MIHQSDQVKGNNPLASYDEPMTRIDNRITDPPILSSHGEIPLGEIRRATDSNRWQDHWSNNLIKSRGTTPWRVTTSHWLVSITGSTIHNSDQVKGNNPLASYGEQPTRTDNRINDPPILSSQGEQLTKPEQCSASLLELNNDSIE